MTSPRLVLASHNQGKLRELRELLRDRVEGLDVETEVVDAGAVGAPDVTETGVSFAENSLLKARAVTRATGLPAVADDSGLCVDVMNGAPGIFSARWSGRHGDDAANLELLLAQLEDVPEEHRGARFRCAASLALPGGEERVEHGEMPGSLLRAPRGTGGFGYDPIFVPAELPVDLAGRTAAEVPPEVKNALSHRGRALEALVPHVRRALGAGSEGRE
ncbi:RdgB/HAM1 family non-canonical purine NTP pyrophosphatase [Rothia sp. AR01]|uniref:dITP/XTP pyrophosphatase n=1 Tax=Rothia santali TaxID=2949643 RepID=A0A9X2KLC3_9MICC|nr:RdgB/HAM1 family non-canonical purine NTP pyrophosphatase [Rothia santali]MCP3425981.1 RdgB/HAM1 family non-canonical purine NTP pyrophosphatase [Rothia santali]